ncbi:MAG: hypothetical protein BJ554DRAFT_407, partial [Olpidium bornovanus]
MRGIAGIPGDEAGFATGAGRRAPAVATEARGAADVWAGVTAVCVRARISERSSGAFRQPKNRPRGVGRPAAPALRRRIPVRVGRAVIFLRPDVADAGVVFLNDGGVAELREVGWSRPAGNQDAEDGRRRLRQCRAARREAVLFAGRRPHLPNFGHPLQRRRRRPFRPADDGGGGGGCNAADGAELTSPGNQLRQQERVPTATNAASEPRAAGFGSPPRDAVVVHGDACASDTAPILRRQGH